jgi:hypothetical protein
MGGRYRGLGARKIGEGVLFSKVTVLMCVWGRLWDGLRDLRHGRMLRG